MSFHRLSLLSIAIPVAWSWWPSRFDPWTSCYKVVRMSTRHQRSKTTFMRKRLALLPAGLDRRPIVCSTRDRPSCFCWALVFLPLGLCLPFFTWFLFLGPVFLWPSRGRNSLSQWTSYRLIIYGAFVGVSGLMGFDYFRRILLMGN